MRIECIVKMRRHTQPFETMRHAYRMRRHTQSFETIQRPKTTNEIENNSKD